MKHIAIAIVMAVISQPLILYLAMLPEIVWGILRGASPLSDLLAPLGAIVFAAPYAMVTAMIVVLFLGVPVALTLRHFKLANWLSIPLSGLLIAIAIGYVIDGGTAKFTIGLIGLLTATVAFAAWRYSLNSDTSSA